MSTELETTETETVAVLTPSEVSLIERAEIDSAIATAKQYPRDIGAVKRKMREFALLDPETAAAMNYALPRGGKTIEGMSVRMAEIAVACYQNISCHTRIIETTPTFVKAQGVCHDLENNVRVGIEVRRRVTPSKTARNPVAALEDALQQASGAASSVAYRTAAFKVIPMALVKPVAEEAKAVAAGDARSFATRRKSAFEAFAELKVPQDQLLAYLNRAAIDSVTTDDLKLLFGLLTAIKEGQTTTDAEFGGFALPKRPKFRDEQAIEHAKEKLAEAKTKIEQTDDNIPL